MLFRGTTFCFIYTKIGEIRAEKPNIDKQVSKMGKSDRPRWEGAAQSARLPQTRRELIRRSGSVVAASALAGVAVPLVHAGENNTTKLRFLHLFITRQTAN